MALHNRRLRIDEAKLKFEIKGTQVDVTIPEEAMMMEGLQIVKRSISNEIFKFVNTLDKINFVETYTKTKQEPPQAKPVEQKIAQAEPAKPKAAKVTILQYF